MSIIDTAKDVYDLVQKSATIELQEKVMQLRVEALTLQEEAIRLRARVKELEDTTSFRFAYGVNWRDGEKDVPFCPHCLETRHLRVHLRNSGKYDGGTDWICTSCANIFVYEGAPS